MKILYVTTISNTVNAFLIPHIKMLVGLGHQVDLAFKIVQDVNPELIKLGCRIHHVDFNRCPLRKSNFMAYERIKKIVLEESYDLVHTHTPIASFLTRLACKKIVGLKILYTAHGFHFFRGASLKNWLIFYPFEKFCSYFTDAIITINKEDYRLAQNKLHASKTYYIPGIGFDTEKIANASKDINKKKHLEIGIPRDAFLILSVGELNKNKNHEVIIKALERLNNPNIHYCIAGEGDLKNYLEKLSNKLGLRNRVHLLGFRKDIGELCKTADIFCFPSQREGLGIAALEAMAAGLPLITSNVHGIVDYSRNGKSGFTCNPSSIEEFANAIDLLFNNKELRAKMGEYNRNNVSKFDIDIVVEQMKKIYKELLSI